MHAIDLKGFDHPLPNLLSVIIKINLEDAFRVRADGVAPPWSRDGRSPPAGPQSPAVRVSLPGWAESESTCRVGEPLPAVRGRRRSPGRHCQAATQCDGAAAAR